MKGCPCTRDCEGRSITCHVDCERYQAFVKQCEKIRADRKKIVDSAYERRRMAMRRVLDNKTRKRGRMP